MELNYLREFVVLVETKHYAEAAERLFLSPASLTRHIQLIEKELGHLLFIRTSRHVELSAFGHQFYPYAKKIVYFQDDYTEKLLDQKRREERLVIGCLGPLTPYKIGGYMAAFRRKHPGLSLEYRQLKAEYQEESLRRNLCDFLFTAEHTLPQNEFDTLLLDKDYLVAVVSQTHPLAASGKVEMDELLQERLVLIGMVAQDNGAFMERCWKEDRLPEFILEEDNGTMLDHASVSGHVVISSRKTVQYFDKKIVRVLEIVPRIESRLVLAFRKKPELTALEAEFLEFLRENGRKKS